MAIIKVRGSVTRVFYEGKGLEVTETYETKSGETVQKRYTVWLKEAGTYDVGDQLQVEGIYSAEIDNWTTKEGEARQTVKVSINNPQIKGNPIEDIKAIFQPTHAPF